MILIGACAQATPTLDSSSTGGDGGSDMSSTATVGMVTITVGSGGGGGGTPCNPGDSDVDDDGDGYTEEEGDCNDCDPNVNPNAVEVIQTDDSEPVDENCDEVVDEPPTTCDDFLLLESLEPGDAARAIDLCKRAGDDGSPWGLVDVAYVKADGTPTQPGLNVGLLDHFGPPVTPQAGARMLALSTGHARKWGHHPDACAGSCNFSVNDNPPPGFPQASGPCILPYSINDDTALQVELSVPSNAHALSFDFAFFSREFPFFVCTPYNDQFVALLDPPPMDAINGNISFDISGNPVSVNLAYVPHCDPALIGDYGNGCTIGANCPSPPTPYCPAGTSFLTDGPETGSTGWLTTTAPVEPNELVRLRFAIWDATDTALDSLVLIDRVRWLATGGITQTTPSVPK